MSLYQFPDLRSRLDMALDQRFLRARSEALERTRNHLKWKERRMWILAGFGLGLAAALLVVATLKALEAL